MEIPERCCARGVRTCGNSNPVLRTGAKLEPYHSRGYLAMALFQTRHLWVEEIADDAAMLVLDGPGKVNTLDRSVFEDIEQALTRIEAEPRFNLCLLRSKKSTSFCQ